MSIAMNFAPGVEMMLLSKSLMMSMLAVQVSQSMLTSICQALNVSLVRFVSAFCGLALHTILACVMSFHLLVGMIY